MITGEFYMKKLREYAERFGDGFPTIPLAWGRSDEEVVELIDKCLAAGKNVYEMGLVSEDDDLKY